VREAFIHFGNPEWRGKVDPSYSNLQLVAAAQAHLEIEGKWGVRTAHWDGQLSCIEAEKLDDNAVDQPLPEDAEVEFNFRGTIKRCPMLTGANAYAQAKAAQDLFGQTLMCSPI
jgi:hypothetical protein